MENQPFNPHAGDARLAKVAAFVRCDVSEVEAAFGNMFAFALWGAERSENGDARKEAIEFRKCAEEVGQLAEKLEGWKMNEAKLNALHEIRDELLANAVVAEHFAEPKAYPATKGRKERARVVADGIARLFANSGRNIGIGKDPYSGDPSTPFGRAVKHALAAFEIEANWYQPAQSAAKRARSNTN